jgi:hypothetical protein
MHHLQCAAQVIALEKWQRGAQKTRLCQDHNYTHSRQSNAKGGKHDIILPVMAIK